MVTMTRVMRFHHGTNANIATRVVCRCVKLGTFGNALGACTLAEDFRHAFLTLESDYLPTGSRG